MARRSNTQEAAILSTAAICILIGDIIFWLLGKKMLTELLTPITSEYLFGITSVSGLIDTIALIILIMVILMVIIQ